MTFYYGMKQMLRSPLKSLMFFLLIGVCAFFLALGGSFWYMGNDDLQGFDEKYKTVVTAEQKYEGTRTIARWDAEKQTYEYSSGGYYGEWISGDVLDIEGVDYISKPRQRPYFGAYIENLYDGIGSPDMGTVEATPVETGAMYPSLAMRVVRALDGTMEPGEIFWLCDHQSPEPDVLVAGKTYVMQISMMTFAHGPAAAGEEETLEYWLTSGVCSSQYTPDGERLSDPVGEEERYYDEVTEGFYETERGKRWIALSSYQDLEMHTIPVQPTDATCLLMHFYNGEARLREGRDITQEEYEKGEKVCLVPEMLAMRLGKKLGDELTLPLWYADYSRSVGDASSLAGGGVALANILNADGELYEVFDEQTYKIVGIYTAEDNGSGSYSAGGNEVVIPWNAVPEGAWDDNIAGYGPMKGSTTSFQIPNGSIGEFQEKWDALGIDGVEIRFYDMGYTQMEEGLENRKLMSAVFLVSGCVMALLILCFFSNLFITGQRERITAERLMGRTKRQCAASILTGMLILSAAGCAAGSALGWFSSEKAAQNVEDTITFDGTFSDNAVADAEPVSEPKPAGALLPCVTGAVLLAVSAAVSAAYMGRNLKKEPLRMLGELEE